MFLVRGQDYSSGQTLVDFGAVWGRLIQYSPQQLWRLFSAIFVHIGLEHFVLNCLTLYFLGQEVEQVFGSRNFFLLYLMSGLMGNIFVLLFTPEVVAAGASTALFGLFSALALLSYVAKTPYIKQLGQRYLPLLVLNLIMSFLPGVSLAGHLGGLLGGLLAAFILPLKVEPTTFNKEQRLVALVLYLLLAVLLTGTALALGSGS
ncbi:rhomboid family intramembrane serine protease [Streptococcus oricebi]|uniref:Rhomboid family intramembrane serine protease n=2 Tax=Streptococcus oricebi TaxID=1547447 RepID=A0ABS5B553_9STRE|nr:rhomboid family intramembrane serine protease [Streptococcus oricebi]